MNDVATITTGLDRVRRSLQPRPKTPVYDASHEPAWRSDYVAPEAASVPIRNMQEFGYSAEEIHHHATTPDARAMAGPFQPLTDTGVQALKRVAAALEPTAENNDYVVTRRRRDVEAASPFVRHMLSDARFLGHLSAIAGVPLVPHPIRSAGTQINYYSADPHKNEVAKWHQDGMIYVFTMTLNDHSEHEGGDYYFYRGSGKDFDRKRADGIEFGPDSPNVEKAPFQNAGDTMFTRGSRVYHAVTPVTSGTRTTFATSLYNPLEGWQDENEFWHSAPDDGLVQTVMNWARLYRANIAPGAYCRSINVELPDVNKGAR